MLRSLPLTLLLLTLALPVHAATDTSMLRVQEGTAALLRGKFDQAITSFDQALTDKDLPAPRQASIHNDRGVAYWRLKRYDEALKDLNRSVELVDNAPATLNNRANVLVDMGKYQEALADLNKAVSLAPAYGAAYNNRGNAHFQLGQYQEAQADYRRATELMPTNAVPYNGRAQVQDVLGRPYSSLRYITRAISLNSKYTAAYRSRALIYQRLEREDQAMADYERLITLAPEDADLYVGRGQVQLFKKKTLAAIADFTKALELDPQNALAFAGRGATQIERKRYDEAIPDLDQAIALDVKLADAYYRRADAFFHINNLAGADADMAKALELSPNFAEIYRLKGEIAASQQDKDAALTAYRKALEIDPFIQNVAEPLKKLAEGGIEEKPVQPIAEAVSGWEIVSPANKRFVATNPTFPNLKVRLEMYGDGQPQILEWTALNDYLKGFGLLRYSAGNILDGASDPTKSRYEFVAIIDVKRQSVVSIEPYLAGPAQAKWEWSKTGVIVTDADGVISAHELHEQPPQPKPDQPRAGPQQQRPWFDEYGGQERRRPRGLFEWLFN